MEFKRVFHPVGQGAFFTEAFFNKEEGYGSTIVYDCGSISSKELLYREIDNFKNEHKSFNILFISHFDDDHINGLKRLLEKVYIDNNSIDSLIQEYSIERDDIKYLIMHYLMVQNPNDRNFILEGNIEELVEKYPMEKYLIEDIIKKYMIEKHIVENEPIKKYLVEKFSKESNLIHVLWSIISQERSFLDKTLIKLFPPNDILNEKEIQLFKDVFMSHNPNDEELTIEEILSESSRYRYDDYDPLMYYISILLSKYPRKTFVDIIEKIFIDNYRSLRRYLISTIIEKFSFNEIFDEYQIEYLKEKYRAKNDFELQRCIIQYGRLSGNANTVEKYLIGKYIIDDLTENGYIENAVNNKVISKEYDLEYIVEEYILNGKRWSFQGFIERYIKNHPRRTVVVIPFLYPNLIKILLSEMRNELSVDTYDALDALFKSGIKIVGLDNDIYGNFSQIESPSMNIEELFKEEIKTIKSFTKIKEKESEDGEVCWYYMPYNTIVDDGRKERFLIELLAALNKSEDTRIGDWFKNQKGHKIEDIYNEIKGIENNECLGNLNNFLMDGVSKSLTDHETVESFVELLKDLYRKASPGIKGVTAINVNSLNLLSYSSNELKNSQIDVISSYVYDNQKFELQRGFFKSIYQKNKENQWYQEYMQNLDSSYYYNEQMRFLNFSCLYTGDSVMENHFFDWITLIRRQFLRSSIGLLQIPHHGRRKNYNKQVLSAPIFSSFINFKKGNKSNAFAKEIENDFCGEGIPCFEITQDEESRFVQTVIWNYQS